MEMTGDESILTSGFPPTSNNTLLVTWSVESIQEWTGCPIDSGRFSALEMTTEVECLALKTQIVLRQ
jgi:hypothetical protein